MTDLLTQIQADGLHLTLKDGMIKARGPGVVLDRWLPVLREHKPEIVRELSVVTTTFNVTVDGTTFIAIAPGRPSLSDFERIVSREFGDRLQSVEFRSRVYRGGATA